MTVPFMGGPVKRSPKLPSASWQRFLTPEEVQHLSDAIAAPFRALVLSAAYLGCRWGELVGLKRTRLNLLHGSVEIVGTLEEVGGAAPRYVEATKTTSSRRKLSVPTFLVDELRNHLSEAPSSDFVFSTVEGHPRGATTSEGATGCRQ